MEYVILDYVRFLEEVLEEERERDGREEIKKE
jgi:hypothetical protein